MTFAGFWRRFGATVVDNIVVTLLFSPILIFTESPFFMAILYLYLISWLYSSLFLCSPWQATLGMKIFRMKVVGYNGNQLSFARASLRFLGYVLSGFTWYVGYLIMVVSETKQTLHDFIAKTYVITK